MEASFPNAEVRFEPELYHADSGALRHAAKAAGATEVEIHDTVLIAAAFCMFNRYVDGLGTRTGRDSSQFAAMAEHIVAAGYGAVRAA